MSQFFFESPLLIGLIGCIVTGIAGLIWVNTMQRLALQIAGVSLATTVVLVLTNLNVVTDRERIEVMLYQVAEAIQNNDHAKVYQAIHPSATNTVLQAKVELPKWSFTEARVTGISSISVDRGSKPATAIAQFNVRVVVTLRGDKLDIPRFVKIYLEELNSQWLVKNYEHHEPTAGLHISGTDTSPSSSVDALRQPGGLKLH